MIETGNTRVLFDHPPLRTAICNSLTLGQKGRLRFSAHIVLRPYRTPPQSGRTNDNPQSEDRPGERTSPRHLISLPEDKQELSGQSLTDIAHVHGLVAKNKVVITTGYNNVVSLTNG